MNYDRETYNRNQRLIDNLVGDGLISNDQARSFMRGVTATSPADIANVPAPKFHRSLKSADEIKPDRSAEIDAQIKADMAANQAAQQEAYGTSKPTLIESLTYLSQNPSIGGAHKFNYNRLLQELSANPDSVPEWNRRFLGLSASSQDRVLNRIALGQSLDTIIWTTPLQHATRLVGGTR